MFSFWFKFISYQGEVKVGDSLEIPALNETRKVKSIQMFRVR